MPPDASAGDLSRQPAARLSDLPPDELLRYGSEFGLRFDRGATAGEMARLIRQRQELLIELDRDALLDIIVWSRRPIRESAGMEELAREIARIQRTHYESLSVRGLAALAQLRGIKAGVSDRREELIDRLRGQDGFWKRISGKRRSWVGSLLSHLLEGSDDEESEYRFLPEEGSANGPRQSLKDHVEEHGLVGGIAQRIRGAADDYIRVKLDEIESRIDRKLDEIDHRLAEWRDREVKNRLKILRITLIFTVLVAVLSLGYNYLNGGSAERTAPSAASTDLQPAD